MVGSVMYDCEPKESRGTITRLMIDDQFQSNGYGRIAIQQVIDRLRSIEDYSEIQTSYVPGNIAAEQLYTSLGFIKTGEIDDGEVVLRMTIERP